MYKDPKGEKIFTSTGHPHTTTLTALPGQPAREDEGLATLRKKIQKQEHIIQEKEKKISELEQELSATKISCVMKAVVINKSM